MHLVACLAFALSAGDVRALDPRLASLRDHSELTKRVFARAEELRLQILVGEIVTKDGKPALERHGFRVDAEYFYPASAIKLCGAVAALEKLEALHREHPAITRTTPLRFHPLFEGEKLREADPSNLDGGTITLEHELRKLFLVSDNDAFNRLYELVGADEMNERFADRGYGTVRILHRLSVARTLAENQRTPRVDFVVGDGAVTLPERTAKEREGSHARGILVGTSRMVDEKLVEGPFDFSKKNAITLVELQDVLVRLARPDLDVGKQPFAIGDDARRWLLDLAREYPADSQNPRYARSEYPDESGKFLLPGLVKIIGKDRLRIANKYGQAYGFSTENAFVEDRASGKCFFVTVTIYTNADGVVNDSVYEYDELALPFFADLGEALAKLYLAP